VPSSQSEQAFEALNSLYQGKAFFDVPPEEFISDIIEALRAKREWRDVIGLPQFRNRLEQLFEIEGLNIASKAFVLQLEYECRFHDARILTDARPVFGADVSEAPKAAILTHLLKLRYHDSSDDIKEIYIAMDSIDIAVLRDVLERARQKEKTLTAYFDEAKLRIIGRS
jgi:hypothetical protein